MWKDSDRKIVFRCKVKERDKVVIAAAAIELYAEVPKAVAAAPRAAAAAPAAAAPAAAAPAAAAPAAPAAAPTALNSADIFVAIRDYLERTPDLVGKTGTVFQFHLKGPDSSYVIDLKNGAGSVTAGTATADVTLTLSDADFLDMTSGKADPQKLFMGGKLKIGGNVMASQKLMFLKNVDPRAAMDAIHKARNAAAPATPAAAAAVASQKAQAEAIFEKLGERLAKSPGLVAEVAAVVHFVIKDPAGAWTVDLQSGAGSVKAGREGAATTTVTLAEEDLVALARGASASALFQQGKLRVDGDMRPAHQLGFMKDLA
jgi:3-hydroxyacyl-CoA dehydrogenase/3a,7a,12a-trihydroxy-5b-cholest-24-enoyl-CoA hydratase